MTYYTPTNIEDLEKLKKIINQKKDIKKLRLNNKILKTTQNYDLADQYAPITKLQEKQTEVIKQGQDDQKQAFETLKAITAPTTQDETLESIEGPSEDEDTPNIFSMDGDISDKISALLNEDNTHAKFKFTKENFNNYKVNENPFKIIDNKIELNDLEFEITPLFLQLFMRSNKADFTQLSDEEKEALVEVVDYAGGLGRDVKSNLYKALKFVEESQYQNIEGQGTSFVFLSSDPNNLVERLEVLVGESFAGNKNAYREASAILAELLRMEEITNTEYDKGMRLFTDTHQDTSTIYQTLNISHQEISTIYQTLNMKRV